jgi:CRP-like cAMP-binding protein
VASPTPESLERVPLFADLDRRELASIAASMRERTFPAGDTVIQEGSGGAGFFVVDDGSAEVSVGGEVRATIGPGDYFGEIALLTGSERTATIRAVTDLRCFGLTAWDFKPLVESNPTIAWKLMTTMAQRLS